MRRLLILIVWLLTCVGAHALPLPQQLALATAGTKYYVSTYGNDNNSGLSPSQAWATITKVNGKTFKPGDSVLFQGGQTFTGAIVMPSSGTCSKRITVGSFGAGNANISSTTSIGFAATDKYGFIVTGITFTGSGDTTNATHGLSIINDQAGNTKLNCITISYVTATGYGGDCISINGSTGSSGFNNLLITHNLMHDCTGNFASASTSCISVSGNNYGGGQSAPNHTYVTVSYNVVYNCIGQAGKSNWTGSGIVIAETAYSTMEHNIAHDFGSAQTHCGGAGAIWTYDANYITIQYNEAYNGSYAGAGCDGGGFDFDGGVANSVMQYNYAHDNWGTGFLAYSYNDGSVTTWANNTYRFNVSQNNGSAGLELSANSTITGCWMYNNTVIGPYAFTEVSSGAENCIVSNNIFRSVSYSDLILQVATASSLTLTGNDWYGMSVSFKWLGTTYSTFAAWQTASGQEKISGSNVGLTTEPRLYVYNGGGTIGSNGYAPSSLAQYQLQSTSPMYETGINLVSQYSLSVGTHDYFGAAIPDGGGKYNVGAGGVPASFAASCAQMTSFQGRASIADTAHEEQYNALICGTVKDGSWAKMDAVYKLATDNSTDALLNLVSSSYPLTVGHTTMTFTADNGYAGDGSAGYLDTGFKPSTAGGNYTQNSASIGAYDMTSRTVAANVYTIGADDNTHGMEISPLQTSAVNWMQANDETGNYATTTNAQGLQIITRTAASGTNSSVGFKNGLQLLTYNATSTGLPSQDILIGALGGGTSGTSPGHYTSDQVGYAFIGSGLTNAQAFALSDRFNTDATNLGINKF